MDGWNWRLERQRELLLWQAWHEAALQRVKKMPELNELLRSLKKTAPSRVGNLEALVESARAKGVRGPWDQGGEA